MEDSNVVTFVISRNIKPGYEKEYDDWLRRYLAIETKAPGYLGTTIIMSGGTKSAIRYIIQRYEDKASMTAWEIRMRSASASGGRPSAGSGCACARVTSKFCRNGV